ncbi:ABC transporter ATP-binding protein [Paraburkholderia lycopersici]|uniref:Lipopolysaccharide transport system ATP-binding protein n=1 Tax=Paraburkholderia lycopersici TaxID=416944 RepID=A0A1G6NF14_9BURK|nr:ABC transporter ATP-binding protein [Paraburkholderia lycopersici]SDC66460.1 lipopolysaccharide transport system ATP-binding protein [Paraburkholderia lycopersici]
MSSDNVAIKIENVSKCYHIYGNPRDRLKQFVYPRLQRAMGREPRRYYEEFWALRDVSFEVKKGEAAGIIGRNGSGKSTLLQIITGTLTPTSGSVTTHGRIAALLELGSGFNPEFTGRENIFLNGAVLGLSTAQIEANFDKIASFADIGLHLDQPVKTYSSGMMVRLAFAVQVQLEPDILIVDEALAVGDALFQKRCFQRIERLVSEGVTLLFVSHDQESVRTLTNSALLLKNGVTMARGVSSDVLLEYRRQLHDEESAYFRAVTEDLADRARANAIVGAQQARSEPDAAPVSTTTSRSETMSFGTGAALVERVETFDRHGAPSSVFHPGEPITIRVHCVTRSATDRLNVAVRIRNKEGVKMYSWGTLNQDMAIGAGLREGPRFWERTFGADEAFYVDFEFNADLGTNLYEIQASVSWEETPDYAAQRLLHWRDEAAFFHVMMEREKYFFGGVADLRMQARWPLEAPV